MQQQGRGRTWSWRLGGLGLGLLVLAGCGSSPSSRVENGGEPETVTANVPRSVPDLTPTQVARTVQLPPLHRALTDAELAAVLNYHPAPGLATPAPRTFAQQAPPGPAVGAADWDVPLRRNWKYIVMHHSASEIGSAAIFHRAHLARGWDGLGYHFVIGNGSGSGDGEVEVGYRWMQQARGAHAGNDDYNEHGIGICLVGDFQTGYPTARQMAAARQLVAYLQARSGIPTSEIIGHDDVPGKRTDCPGRHFSVAQFRQSLGTVVTAPAAVAQGGAPAVVRTQSAPPASRNTPARALPASRTVMNGAACP